MRAKWIYVVRYGKHTGFSTTTKYTNKASALRFVNSLLNEGYAVTITRECE